MNGHPNRQGWFRGSDSTTCKPLPPDRRKTYRLILLGPPGVGKGTQAERLTVYLRTCHLSTGELFRLAACEAQNSPAMTAALDAMRRGELVSDDLVMSMIRERSHCLRCHGGFLLDGIPRTLRQAESLELLLSELDVPLDAVLSYELELDAIVDRLSGRRTCSECMTVFHTSSRPPMKDGVCDHCGGTLVQRDDDRSDAVRVRMEAYTEATRPLDEFYAARNKLLRIPAHGTPSDIFQATMDGLDAHLAPATR